MRRSYSLAALLTLVPTLLVLVSTPPSAAAEQECVAQPADLTAREVNVQEGEVACSTLDIESPQLLTIVQESLGQPTRVQVVDSSETVVCDTDWFERTGVTECHHDIGSAPYRALIGDGRSAIHHVAFLDRATATSAICPPLAASDFGQSAPGAVVDMRPPDVEPTGEFAKCLTVAEDEDRPAEEILSFAPVYGGPDADLHVLDGDDLTPACGEQSPTTHAVLICRPDPRPDAYTVLLRGYHEGGRYNVYRYLAPDYRARCFIGEDNLIGGPPTTRTTTHPGQLACVFVSGTQDSVTWLDTDPDSQGYVFDQYGELRCETAAEPCVMHEDEGMHVVISTGAEPGKAELDAWRLADDVGDDWGGRFTGCVRRSSYATGFGAWERYLSNANRAFCIILKDDGDDQYRVDVTRFDGGTNPPAPVLIPADDGPPVPCAGSGPWTCDVPHSIDEQRGVLMFRLPDDLDSVGIRVEGTCTAPTPCGQTVFNVAGLSPDRASAGFHKSVTTTVSGVALQPDSRVILTKEGNDWIGGQVVDAAADGTWLKARFDLSAVSEVGTWQVEVRGPYGRARGAIQLDWGPLGLTTRPTIRGTPRVDGILTATAGTWRDEPTSLTYQWRANGVPIRGAAGRTYRLPAKHLGKSISVSVTADTPWHLPTTATTRAVRVGRGIAPSVERRPRLSGFRDVGGRVWTTPGRWSKQPSSYAYAWYIAGRKLTGATAPSLRLRPWMKGKRVKVVVTARRAGCYSGTAPSQLFTVR